MEKVININMNGKEYIKYLETRKIKLSNNTKKALPYFLGCFLGLVVVSILLADITYTPTPAWFSDYYRVAPDVVKLSWDGVAKFTVAYFLPWIVLAVLVSWVVHGVGFFIFRG